ncbi:PREDICTED: 39S ribosomal protein L55, mitochondrial [Trachymyrmex septentrionalis]|nr:PREDICTED: 39S ribosomal protein L55, mitochondrial [Trachymyrmex septentrionalis]
MITSLARIGNSATVFRRSFNCWTAAITKKHRPVYERTYPTTLVFSDGSSIEIEYHEPRKIIVLPLNLAELTEAERKRRLEMRKPKTKIVIAEEFEDNFDENRYLNFKK